MEERTAPLSSCCTRLLIESKLRNLDSMSNLVQHEERGAVLSSILNQDKDAF
jgi:hypothetical protein